MLSKRLVDHELPLGAAQTTFTEAPLAFDSKNEPESKRSTAWLDVADAFEDTYHVSLYTGEPLTVWLCALVGMVLGIALGMWIA